VITINEQVAKEKVIVQMNIVVIAPGKVMIMIREVVMLLTEVLR
jgi:hypothetical protein